ncbi:hypothetical protein LTR16_004409 [Cryomyces antarcticus]|uniref:Uncharacterized protein n=1 Tax=Cryomyces antarcticus TaxID=329879 RepID=A0ABR0LN68_9PEZI|nr:hypothetical protein LTR16_004409 [Cryomyces antarcticus]
MPNNRELHRIDLTEPDLIDLTDSDDVNENVPDTIAGAEPTSSELGKRQASTRPQHDEHPYYAVAGAEVTTLEPTKHKALNLEHDQDEYFAEFIASVEPATDEPLQQYAPTSPGRDKHLPDAADGGVSLLDEAAAYIAGMDVAMNEPNYQQALTTLGQHGNFFHTVNGGMSLSNEAADLIAGMLLPINEPGKQQALTSSEQDYSSSDTDVDGDLFPNSTTEQRAIFTPERVPEHDRHFLHSPTPPFRPRSPSPQPPSSPGKCAYRRTAHPACPFSNAVVYLAPCIATTPYIRDDLAPAHGIVLVNSLTHWTRDSAPSTSTTSTTGTATALAETLAESQSHPGLVKILLLETRRREACRAAVDAVTRAVRERVLCYDWRVLEDLADAEAEAHAEAMMDAREEAAGGGGRPVPCLQEQSALLHRWYAGRVEWDARRACAVWTRAGSGCELSFLG